MIVLRSPPPSSSLLVLQHPTTTNPPTSKNLVPRPATLLPIATFQAQGEKQQEGSAAIAFCERLGLIPQVPKMLLRSFLRPVTKRHVEQRVLPTTPDHLFRIICDVDSYSSFLPLCTYSKIHPGGSKQSFEATLTVGIPPLLQETYVSRVTVGDWVVRTESIESKWLDSLRSEWKLSETVDRECLVDFSVEMTVSDPLIVGALDQFLEQVAGRQVDAFAERCRYVPIQQ